MNNIIKSLLNRMVIVGTLLVIQLVVLLVIIWKFSSYFVYFYFAFVVISLMVVLWIVNNKSNPAYKLAWIIPILLFPVFGGLFYLMFGNKKISKRTARRMSSIYHKTLRVIQQDQDVMDEIIALDKSVAKQATYIHSASSYPIYKNTTSEFLSSGEIKFERLKEELLKAEHYIFLEYFIVQEGLMWNSILDILIEKVKQGVDVRFIYDDVGCLKTLPYNYDKQLEKLGIKCKVFNPFIPVLTTRLNNRDHRKIIVIDGHTAFTGGINLADEYINAYVRFGHWKDTAIMLKGEAVWNFTVMFLTMWDFLNDTDEDYEEYRPHHYHTASFSSDGYVMPYGDSPLDDEVVGENVYINMINRAKDYIYINTPYLIVDNETVTALCLAAKSGIDVRIVTPHIPDKWYVHMVTRAYYPTLIENGVTIYEYTPGFIHAKSFVVDDELAIIGTINLDYRSLYLHFECATWLYRSSTVLAMKEDFLATLDNCHQITLEACREVKWHTRFARSIMRVFAPLM
ncbi:cardiolipin synthase [Paenibacillus marinisediminis]